jgi:hypothetical protein
VAVAAAGFELPAGAFFFVAGLEAAGFEAVTSAACTASGAQIAAQAAATDNARDNETSMGRDSTHARAHRAVCLPGNM